MQRIGQRAYSTQRDCVIQAAALAKPGAGRDELVRLAVLLALSQDEPHVTGATLRLFAPLINPILNNFTRGGISPKTRGRRRCSMVANPKVKKAL